MYSSKVIANLFIKNAFNSDHELTVMKLLKLVYIAHGWSLAFTEKPLVKSEIQAWKYGPVIPDLYYAIQDNGRQPIDNFIRLSSKEIEQARLITEEQETMIKDIWEIYGDLDGIKLSALTHKKNTPWDIVWNQFGGGKKSGALISDKEIMKYYKQKLLQLESRIDS